MYTSTREGYVFCEMEPRLQSLKTVVSSSHRHVRVHLLVGSGDGDVEEPGARRDHGLDVLEHRPVDLPEVRLEDAPAAVDRPGI